MVEPSSAVAADAAPVALRDIALLAGLAVVLPILRCYIAEAGGFDLHFDEAQYWEWSQQLDWSYYSKGPLVAWLIAASTGLFGHGEWQVRLFAWLAYDLFLLLLFGFARQFWQSRRAGWWAVALGLTTPLYFPLGQVMTTDVFLFVCWTWGLWAAWRALYRHQDSAWYELGAAVGIGGLAKFSIGLLPFFLGVGLVLRPAGRRVLGRWPPWGGVLLALLVLSQVLLWNAAHGWPMLHHEQSHVLNVTEEGGWEENAGDLLEFLGGQWLALSPLVAVALLRALARPPRPAEQRWLWGLSLAVLVFFFAKATVSKVQLNWPAPAYIGLLLLLAGRIDGLTDRWRRWVVAGVASSVLLLVVAFFPLCFGLASTKAPFKDLRGWRESVATVAQQAQSVQFLMVPSYHLAGGVAFYWPERLSVYPVAENRRFSQHDFWPGIEREAGRDGVYVTTNDSLPPRLLQAFARCQPLPPVPAVARDGGVLRTLYSWRCESYRPIAWPKPVHY
ncbi:MAG: glycosyltransferase family 39 protein [Candidatus Competibacteraceae bacterium]|nr:glycosyltransferase family 39 protein [Candidatus Competibacteraceae bacterium]MBK8899387.1 glycosyltransferase family 39 protein [Candidatus Competibacteraceae bacterium]MBK8964391.1 glycosyltransferase family 39 protein [Candidatus Competibacteraceae bacterium]MBK9952380.1 glycosyltransferase family 39 protein [Candidatus Competibacteraceae bacterium]